MVPPYPFFGFPPFRRPYPYSYPPFPNSPLPPKENVRNPYSPSTFPKKKGSTLDSSPISKQKDKDSHANVEQDTEQCFEIFGLKLYFDDLLILALLFFLYQEDVKDSYLYLALILLLLS